jgi:hypothetical protein
MTIIGNIPNKEIVQKGVECWIVSHNIIDFIPTSLDEMLDQKTLIKKAHT